MVCAAASESVFVVHGDWSGDAITNSLRALLPTRERAIAKHRFTLLDTFDGRVRRAGARLTRSGDDRTATFAWQDGRRGSSLTIDLTQPVSFAWDLPRGPLQRALTPVVGVRRLLAQADAESQGSQLDVLDDQQKTIARLRIESGKVRRPQTRTAWRALPTVVTLSALRGYEDVYRRLIPVLESRPGIASCPEGVQALMLRHAGTLATGATSVAIELEPTILAGTGARQIHRALTAALITNEPGLRANVDSEFLHDFRVALRRTRSLLGQLRCVFPANVVEHFGAEFSWMGRLTGPPRDLDVLVLSLRAQAEDFDAGGFEALLAFLGQIQDRERQSLIEALDSPRYRALLADWQRFLHRPLDVAGDAPAADQPLVEVVSRRAWRLSRRLIDSAETMTAWTAAEQVHEVRIVAKKLRYLIDVTPGFYDPVDLGRILGALKKLQRVLGDFNDAHVQESRLIEYGHALVAEDGATSARTVLAQLAQRRREQGERLRTGVLDKMSEFASRATRTACRRAFKRSATEGRAQ